MFVPLYRNDYYKYSYQPLDAPFKAVSPIIADIYKSQTLSVNTTDNEINRFKFYLGIPNVKNSTRYTFTAIGNQQMLDTIRDELIGQDTPNYVAGIPINELLAQNAYKYYIYDYLFLYAVNKFNTCSAYKNFCYLPAAYNMQDYLTDYTCSAVLPNNVAAFHQLYLQILDKQKLASFDNPVVLNESNSSPNLVEQFRWFIKSIVQQFTYEDIEYLVTPFSILNPYKTKLEDPNVSFADLLQIADELHDKLMSKLILLD